MKQSLQRRGDAAARGRQQAPPGPTRHKCPSVPQGAPQLRSQHPQSRWASLIEERPAAWLCAPVAAPLQWPLRPLVGDSDSARDHRVPRLGGLDRLGTATPAPVVQLRSARGHLARTADGELPLQLVWLARGRPASHQPAQGSSSPPGTRAATNHLQQGCPQQGCPAPGCPQPPHLQKASPARITTTGLPSAHLTHRRDAVPSMAPAAEQRGLMTQRGALR